MLQQSKRYFTLHSKRSGTYTGGMFKGIIKAPLPVVWNRVKEFQDLSWWHPTKFHIERTPDTDGKETRFVTAYDNDDIQKRDPPFTSAYEYLEKLEASPEKCLISYSVKVTWTKNPERIEFYDRCKILNFMEFVKFDKDTTIFHMHSQYQGPPNLIKLSKHRLDFVYRDPYMNMKKIFEANDLLPEVKPKDALTKAESFLRLVHENRRAPRDFTSAFVPPDFKKPVKLEDYTALFPFLTDLKKATRIPSAHDAMTPKKIQDLLTGLLDVPIDELNFLSTNIIQDLILHPDQKDVDPWMQFFSRPPYDQKAKARPLTDLPAAYFQDDYWGEYYFNGGSVFNIHKAHKLSDIPHYANFVDDKVVGSQIEDLITSGNLYFADYKCLEPFEYPNTWRGMYIHAPTAVMYKDPKTNKLTPLAIRFNKPAELGSHGPAGHRIVTNKDPEAHWHYAKLHVSVADLHHFQFNQHLGIGHLGTEPLAVALHNVFALNHPDHIIGKFLRPPVQGLIGINHFAAITLIDSKNSMTDQTFSLGTENALKLFHNYYKNEYDFNKVAPDADLLSRGFSLKKEDDPTYTYKHDALDVFSIIEKSFAKIVDLHYKEDKDVALDPAMQQLAVEINKIPRMNNQLKTKKDLVRFGATLWWICTGYHSVSFSVEDYEAYIPFRPTLLTKPMPLDAADDFSYMDIETALPYPLQTFLVLTLIAGVTQRDLSQTPPLTKVASPFSTKTPDSEESKANAIFQDMVKDFTKLSGQIQKRNAAIPAGTHKFKYLDPDYITSALDA